MSEKLKIVIFYCSVRDGRMNDRIGNFVKKTVQENDMEATVLDPKVLKFELLKVPLHWMSNPADAPEWLRDANEKIKNADGFLIVSSEYNCGVPPALSNMLDHFSPNSFRHRPCGLVTYSLGSFGGSRMTAILPPMICELGMLTVPVPVMVPNVSDQFDELGNCTSTRIADNISHIVKLTGWYARGMKTLLNEGPPPEKKPEW